MRRICVTSDDRKAFSERLNLLFSEGWQIVPGSLQVAVGGATQGYADGAISAQIRSEFVAVLQTSRE
jgi:hypothetical protein